MKSSDRNGKARHRWREWVRTNKALIAELDLPLDVVESREDFDYLLLHGYNRAGWWNEAPWFETFDCGDPKRDLFWDLLKAYHAEFYPGDVDRQLERLRYWFGPKNT